MVIGLISWSQWELHTVFISHFMWYYVLVFICITHKKVNEISDEFMYDSVLFIYLFN